MMKRMIAVYHMQMEMGQMTYCIITVELAELKLPRKDSLLLPLCNSLTYFQAYETCYKVGTYVA